MLANFQSITSLVLYYFLLPYRKEKKKSHLAMPEAPSSPKIVRSENIFFLQVKEEKLKKNLCKSHWQNTKSNE